MKHHEICNHFSKQYQSKAQSTHHHTQQLNTNIDNQFLGQQLKIYLQQSPLEVQKYKQLSSFQKSKQLLQSIKYQKNNLISKLNQLNKEQINLRGSISEQYKKSKKFQERSFITQEEKKSIKALIQSKKQYEQKLQEKINNYMSKAKQYQSTLEKQQKFRQQTKIMQRKLQMRSKNKLRLVSSVNKSPTIKERYHQRQQYLYKSYHQKYRMRQHENNKYFQLMLTKKRQKMKTDFSQIKQHSREFDQLLEKRKLQSQKDHSTKSKTTTINLLRQSSFYKRAKQQMSQNKKKLEEQRKLKRQFTTKIKDFQLYITQKFKPKIKESSKFVLKQRCHTVTHQSFAERKQIGNKYLQYAKKKKKNFEILRKQSINPQKPMSKFAYLKRHKVLQTFEKQTFERALKKLIEKKQPLSQQDMIKAIRLTKKIQKLRNNNGNTESEYQRARKKIQLLEALFNK